MFESRTKSWLKKVAKFYRRNKKNEKENPLNIFGILKNFKCPYDPIENQLKGETTTNKTRTPQVGAISKAQKAQNIFLEKNFEIFEKKILSENVAQCRKM